MNKYLYILGLVGAALFSACSNSDDLSIVESPAIDEAKESALIYEAGQNSEVPITLGISQSRGVTRTPLESVDDIDGLAVFCLATGSQKANIPIINNWFNDKDGELGGLLVRMKNVPATVSSTGEVSYTGHYYYPMTNWMKYNFYAYYPKQDDSNVTFTSSGNQVSVKFTALDGIHDVIWGRAYPDIPDSEHATGHDPYCADYFRFNTTSKGPQFKFEHKLVQFKFSVKATDAAVTAGAKVTDMYISNAIKQLTLIVANKNDTIRNGKVTPATTKIGDLKIKKFVEDVDRFDGTDGKALTLTTSEQVVGYLMLPAPPNLSAPGSAGFKYHISGTVKFSDESEQDISIYMNPKTQIPGSDPAEYGFESGKIYNILITIDKN